jgi:hypothetical protein
MSANHVDGGAAAQGSNRSTGESIRRRPDGPREPRARRSGSLRVAALSAALCVGGLTAVVWAGGEPQLPRTGQTKSYGPRDDGALQAGTAWPRPRFVPTVNRADDTGIGAGGIAGNGICDGAEPCNGAVLDRLSGLTWLQNAGCLGERGWDDALASANQLASGQCGLTDGSAPGDWRLPSVNELWSLADFACANPALSDRQGTGCFAADPNPVFSNVTACGGAAAVCLPEYWSSTVHAGRPWLAWLMYSFDGGLGYGTRTGFTLLWPQQASVWPVRGGA